MTQMDWNCHSFFASRCSFSTLDRRIPLRLANPPIFTLLLPPFTDIDATPFPPPFVPVAIRVWAFISMHTKNAVYGVHLLIWSVRLLFCAVSLAYFYLIKNCQNGLLSLDRMQQPRSSFCGRRCRICISAHTLLVSGCGHRTSRLSVPAPHGLLP